MLTYVTYAIHERRYTNPLLLLLCLSVFLLALLDLVCFSPHSLSGLQTGIPVFEIIKRLSRLIGPSRSWDRGCMCVCVEGITRPKVM